MTNPTARSSKSCVAWGVCLPLPPWAPKGANICHFDLFLLPLQKNNDMSAVTAIYHLVINTYRREMTLPQQSSEILYNYIAATIRNKNCHVYEINGIENHIHILLRLRPDVCLSDLVRDIKLSSNNWIKIHQASFPMFSGWGKEYGAFTYALRDMEMVANYIKRQREHHQRQSFEDEYKHLLNNAGIEWNEYRLT